MIMNRRLFTLILSLLCAMHLVAVASEECMLFPVSLQERCAQSTAIVEGKVIARQSFFNSDKSMIYTAYRIEPYRVWKGALKDQFELIVKGGIVGNQAVHVSPGIELNLPMNGIFFLQSSPVHNPHLSQQSPIKPFDAYGGVQGIITYSEDNISARDPFATYHRLTLYATIESLVGKMSVVYKNLDIATSSKYREEQTLNASISSINPTTLTAGNDAVLTINGSGFGASYTGNAKVEFKSADDGGATWVSALASHIVSWSNTQIQVEVRTSAGTGQVRVTGVDGTQATSSQTLTISYNLLNVTSSNIQYKTWLQNQDGSGGMTFTFNTNFNNNTDAANAFKRALQSWRCGTFVNLKIATGTTSVNSESGSDGVNVVAFNDAGLPSGVLGVTYNYWTSCGTGVWYPTAIDMIFRNSPTPSGWNFGPQATTGNRFDFESVCLHELGHAHQLGHVINTAIIMHYAIGPNSDNRNLNTSSDIPGGADVVAYSTSSKSCGPSIMTALNASNCQVSLPPVAQFTASVTAGCAPLTVNFTDQSSNTPTQWAWDIDNNGSTDYTTQNPTHTYTSPGTYSVKLTATNGNGANTLTRTNYITVNSTPTARSGGIKRPCFGAAVTLGATPAASGGQPPYTYSWSPTNNLSNPTIANPIISAYTFNETRVYTLTVTDANNCVSTSRDTIIPYPQLSVDAGVNRNACVGSSITLGGTPTVSNGTGPYNYSWTPTIGIVNPTSSNPSLTVTAATKYYVTVTDANGCSNIDSVTISLFPQPRANVGEKNKIICSGSSTTIGSGVATNGTAPYTYSWSPTTGLNNPALPAPTASPTQTTLYILTITDANNCTVRDTVTVTVNPLPQPIITAEGSLSLCDGDTLTLTTGQFTSYEWWNGATTRSIKVTTGGIYTVKATNQFNCSALSPAVTVTILPKPTPSITPLRPAVFCEGDSTVLDAGTGFATYLWSNGANSRTITAKQSGTYTVTVTNQQNCKAQSAPIQVTAKPYPDKVITGPNSLCENAGATYNVKASDNTSTTWQVINGDIIEGQSTNSIKVQWKQQSGSVSVVRDRLGCVSVQTYSVTISSTLKPVISRTNGIPCTGNTVTLAAPQGYKTYLWSNGATTQTIAITENGTFTVKVTDDNTCEGTSEPFTITFAEKPPIPTINRIGDTLFSSPASAYQWYRNAQTIPGATEQRFTLKQSGDYNVEITDLASCSAQSAQFSVGVLDIQELDNPNSLIITPNPVNDRVYFHHPYPHHNQTVILYSMLGTVVFSAYNTDISTIDMSALPAGIYLFSVEVHNTRYTTTLIKQ